MDKITYRKELSISREVDVLVIGAGPAGLGAAISAARNGAETLLIDVNGSVGGQAVAGLVGPFMTSYDAKNENMVIKGVFEEIVDRMVARGGAIHPEDVPSEHQWSGFFVIGHAHVGPFDHECFKKVSTEMLQESGASLLLHTQFIDTCVDNGKITGAVIANKSGISMIKAKVFIDCSGDADVAARSGVDFTLGNPEDGNIQPATLFFRIGNVDTEALRNHMAEHRTEIKPFYGPFSWLIKEKAVEWGDIPRAEICMFESPEPGEYRINVSRILDIDGTKAEDLTKAELIGLEQVHKIFNFLKKYAIGFENAKFIGTASMIGVRESRHIHGKYILTADDVKACRVPDDSIAVMATNLDTHNKNDAGGTFYLLENGDFFGVPYSCLLPEGVDNLLVAGRSISAESVAASAIRMIPCCIAFGQAAGTAAAIAVNESVDIDALDINLLRKKLIQQGAYLGN